MEDAMQRFAQATAAIGARALAIGAAVVAVTVTASYYSSDAGLPTLALAAVLGDAASPLAFAAVCRGGQSRGLRGVALVLCCGVALLSANSTFQLAAQRWISPITAASAAGDRLASIRAEIAPLAAAIAAREAERRAERLAISEARRAEEAARERRDAPSACDGGRFQPNDANPRCKAQTAAWEIARDTRARFARDHSAAEDAHRRREAGLAQLRRDERAAADASAGGNAGFKGLSEVLGVSETQAATIVAAILAFVVAALGTVGFALAEIAAPFPAPLPAKRRASAAKAKAKVLKVQPEVSQHAADVVSTDLPQMEPERRAEVVAKWRTLINQEKITAAEAAERLKALYRRKVSARSLRRWAAEQGQSLAVAAE